MPAVAVQEQDRRVRPAVVTIRFPASPEDVRAGVALIRRYHDEAGEEGLIFDGDRLSRMIEREMERPAETCLLMAERRGRLAGVLMGQAAPHHYSPSVGATLVFFYVAPEHRGSEAAVKLLHGFRRWARNRGAARLYVGVTSGIDPARTDRLLKRLGFRLRGGNYVCALTGPHRDAHPERSGDTLK